MLPPRTIVDAQAARDGSARLRNELKIRFLFGPVAFAEEEAFRRGEYAVSDSAFQNIEIVVSEKKIDAIEGARAATFGTVELLHPAVEVGVLAPSVDLFIAGAFEIDGLGGRVLSGECVHI